MDGVKSALAVMKHGLRPEVPADAPPAAAALMRACWAADSDDRPTMAEVVIALETLTADLEADL